MDGTDSAAMHPIVVTSSVQGMVSLAPGAGGQAALALFVPVADGSTLFDRIPHPLRRNVSLALTLPSPTNAGAL
jgi:hypothetical protein